MRKRRQLGDGAARGHTLFIRPVGGHRVEGIHSGKDADFQRHLVGSQPVGVAASIQPLVVAARNPGDVRGKAGREQVEAVDGVALHGGVFRIGQPPRLGQDFRLLVAFADVMIQRGEQQRVRRLRGHVQALADGLRKAHHAAAVVIGVVILLIDLRVQIVEVVDKPHEIIENRLGCEAQKPHVRLGRDGNVVVETSGVKRIAGAERLRLAFVGVQRQFARQQRVIFQIDRPFGIGREPDDRARVDLQQDDVRAVEIGQQAIRIAVLGHVDQRIARAGNKQMVQTEKPPSGCNTNSC